jgi:hypothetical protein
MKSFKFFSKVIIIAQFILTLLSFILKFNHVPGPIPNVIFMISFFGMYISIFLLVINLVFYFKKSQN